MIAVTSAEFPGPDESIFVDEDVVKTVIEQLDR